MTMDNAAIKDTITMIETRSQCVIRSAKITGSTDKAGQYSDLREWQEANELPSPPFPPHASYIFMICHEQCVFLPALLPINNCIPSA